MDTAQDCIEIVEAIEVLEYHNKNFLSNPLTDNGNCCREKIRLLRKARELMEGENENYGAKEIASKFAPKDAA